MRVPRACGDDPGAARKDRLRATRSAERIALFRPSATGVQRTPRSRASNPTHTATAGVSGLTRCAARGYASADRRRSKNKKSGILREQKQTPWTPPQSPTTSRPTKTKPRRSNGNARQRASCLPTRRTCVPSLSGCARASPCAGRRLRWPGEAIIAKGQAPRNRKGFHGAPRTHANALK